jgi:HK97 family phage major capsid protein
MVSTPGLAPAERRGRTSPKLVLCADARSSTPEEAPMLALILALALALYAFTAPLLTPSARAQRKLARTAVAGVRISSKPRILGYRKSGAPIWSIAGADPRGSDTLSLDEERTQLMARLEDPNLTPEERTAATEQANALAVRITEHNDQVSAATAARSALLSATPTRAAQNGPAASGGQQGVQGGQQRELPGMPVARETLGQLWLREGADQLATLRANGGNGKASVTVPGEVRALFATTNNPVNTPRYPETIIQNDQALQVLDLVDRQPMSGTSIEWVQESTAPNAAAEVAEGSAKPEATFTLTLQTDTAATIAHWVNITRQALDDDSMLRGYVEGRLSYGLMKRLNGQIVSGNGTAPNLRGILNVSGIGTYTAATATEAAVISVRKAKTVAELSEYEPDSVVVNPIDWEAIELSTDTAGMFRVSPNVQSGAPSRIWGLNVVSTTAITGTTFGTTGGTFLVGAFRAGATLWERNGVDIFITDSHASNFTSNILTLLAELRAALTVWRPKAFVKGTFGASRT